jgi:hypothetical protein
MDQKTCTVWSILQNIRRKCGKSLTTPVSLWQENSTFGQAWWYTPIIPATQKDEAEGSRTFAQPGQHSETPYQEKKKVAEWFKG